MRPLEYGRSSDTTATYRHNGVRYRACNTAATLGEHDGHQRGSLRVQPTGPTVAGLMFSDPASDGSVVVLHGLIGRSL
ncbi:MAG: hypothetical protein OXG29_09760 [Gammaproteobacteria bacterium]|nr:hypothetical protein [Gammaproteobacteria bacterium]